MNLTAGPYRSEVGPGRDGFMQLLHAEWTKFRTARGWVVGMAAAALMVVLSAVLTGMSGGGSSPPVALGPGGDPVTDSFYFTHQPMGGNGTITVKVTSLNDRIAAGSQGLRNGSVPWAKAGLIVKENRKQGSAYAAVMVTSGHGVRMQYDYTHDKAGLPGPVSITSPRWLRLTRSGDTIVGYDSTDGTHWHEVGTAHLAGLSPTVLAGLFVACPPHIQGTGSGPAVATATFGHPRLRGRWPTPAWSGEQVGANSASFSGYPQDSSGGFTATSTGFTVTGAGDIAPAVREALGTGGVIADLLIGTFAALIAVIVVGALFITAEYRDGLIRTTLTASPRRGRVLAAKAIVLGSATFVAGLAAAAVAVPIGERLAHAKGVYLFPVTPLTELRVEVGTAALLAVAAILALALGAILRRSAGAVTGVIAAIVLPYILVATPFMPATVAEWMTRVTPTAAFATQQTLTVYHQVNSVYIPANGYYPLAPWAGLGVLSAYAALALGIAALLLHRRDA